MQESSVYTNAHIQYSAHCITYVCTYIHSIGCAVDCCCFSDYKYMYLRTCIHMYVHASTLQCNLSMKHSQSIVGLPTQGQTHLSQPHLSQPHLSQPHLSQPLRAMHSSASELKAPALCNARELVPLVSVIEKFHYMCIWPELKVAHNTVVYSCYTVSPICSIDLSFTAQWSTYSKYVRMYVCTALCNLQ